MAEVLIGPATYADEPERHPDLIINSQEPFNAEPRPSELLSDYITPIPFFYKRNHGPVPILESQERYRLQVEGLVPRQLSLSLDDIKNFPKHTVVATLMCAGNRRTEMSTRRKVKGVGWGLGALGNAVWGGALLSDVLQQAGIAAHSPATAEGGRHVEFVSVDKCKEENGGVYKASLPLSHATDPATAVLLAYEMNGEPLSRDHGFPLRVVVPGVIGARSVKWLTTILLRADESQGFFVQRDYKMFPPSVDWNNIEWNSRRPIMDFPIQSAITSPQEGDSLAPGEIVIQGYAVVGGGRGVERVEVSVDGGATWQEATRKQQSKQRHGAAVGEGGVAEWGPYVADEEEKHEKWAWVLWELKTRVEPPCKIVVRAVDVASNTQPSDADSIWNLRGVLNNSWHVVNVDSAPLSKF